MEGFSWALADYTMPKIIKAMRQYVLRNSDIPSPADIRKLLAEDERNDHVDNTAISSETLRGYRAKGIPLTTAQRRRLAREDEEAGWR